MSRQPKLRWRVVNHRGGQAHVLAEVRRLPGALTIRDEHVDREIAILRKHGQPGDRIISGPTEREHEVAVVLLVPGHADVENRFAVEPA